MVEVNNQKLYSLVLQEGIVEDNSDPNKVGRVRVRIPSRQNSSETPVNALPWYSPVCVFGSAYNSGSLCIPEVGSFVWILEQEVMKGCPPIRIYLGGSGYGTGSSYKKKVRDLFMPSGALETPSEIQLDSNAKVLFKSINGSSIYFTGNDDIIINHKDRGSITIGNVISITKAGNNTSSNITLNQNTISITQADKSVVVSSDAILLNYGKTLIQLKDGIINIVGDTINVQGNSINITGTTNKIEATENNIIKAKADNNIEGANNSMKATTYNKLEAAHTDIKNDTTIDGIKYLQHYHLYQDHDTNDGEGASGGNPQVDAHTSGAK